MPERPDALESDPTNPEQQEFVTATQGQSGRFRGRSQFQAITFAKKSPGFRPGRAIDLEPGLPAAVWMPVAIARTRCVHDATGEGRSNRQEKNCQDQALHSMFLSVTRQL
jgi:hypothetical protein